MPNYRVNNDGVAHARELIDAGEYDDRTPWSEAAPSTPESREELDDEGYEGYGRWHLAVDQDAGELLQRLDAKRGD